jgi:hypothetical protein
MDARLVGIGVVIPDPMGPPSELGNVSYIDESGILYPITNMFKGEAVHRLTLASDPEIREETLQEVVAVATNGIELRRMDRFEYQRC